MFKTLARCALCALVVFLATGLSAVSAQTFHFSAVLDGPQAGTTSQGTGTANVLVNSVTGEISVDGSFAGLEGSAFAAHIHLLPQSPPIFVMSFTPGSSGTFSGTGFLEDPTELQRVVDGDDAYINIHSSAFPPGEIWGFLRLENRSEVFELGDVNRDEIVNFLDITPFIAVLSSGVYQPEADINGDFVVNYLDISPFNNILSSPPQPISTAADLDQIRTSLNGNFYLTNNIDLATIPSFEPIGTDTAPFTGTLDGNGYTIKNLTINTRPEPVLDFEDPFFEEDNIGLFGVTDGATIENLNLQNVAIVGEQMVGSLIGQCRQSVVNNCSADGAVVGLRQVGGLIGFMGNADATNCVTDVEVEYCEIILGGFFLTLDQPFHANSFWFGGLVGHAHPYRFPGRAPDNTGDGSRLTTCVSHGDVYGSFISGGVVGNFHGSTGNQCFAFGNVENRFSVAGGLAGYMQREPGLNNGSPVPIQTVLMNSASFGDVTINAFGTPFGFITGAGGPGVVQPFRRPVGGFVGYVEGGLIEGELPLSVIENCFASGDVTNLEPRSVFGIAAGGFVGFTEVFTLIGNCEANGNVTSEDGASTGGFVGWGEGVIEDSEASGNVIGPSRAGAFAGQVAATSGGVGTASGPFRGQFLRCVSFGDIQSNLVAAPNLNLLGLGGFVGYSFGGVQFTNCESHGTTIANSIGGGFVGGFIGHAGNDTITECFSTGNVITAFGAAGGFIGRQRLHDGLVVADCYSTGDLEYTGSGTPQLIGGFIGRSDESATIENCYSAGNVDASGSSVGGFEGSGTNIQFSGCYWDTTTAGQPTGGQPSGVNGRTTAQMQQQATFVGWDFVNIWDIVENASYPFFR